jgi:HEAT repeat protein
VPTLIEALTDADLHVRKAAVLALGNVGPAAAAAVPTLGEVLLRDDEATVRRRAAVALGEINDARAIPALKEASSGDVSEEVREMAAAALASIKAGALRLVA